MARVLMVSEFYPPRIGGVERFVQELSQGLVASGNQCTVLCTGDHDADETILGVRVIRVRNWPVEFHGLNLRFASRLRGLLESHDVVHINSFYPLLSNTAAHVCRRHGIPYVFSSHYHGQGHSRFGRVLYRLYLPFSRFIFENAEAIHCCSRYEGSLVERDFGENLHIEVIPHGTSYDDLSPRERNGRLLFVGRMEEYKGPQRALAIIKELKSRGRPRGLDLIGSGPMREELEEEVRALGLDDLVSFRSGLPDDELLQMMREASLLVLLSDAEAYGLVVSEALSNGTPCLVSDRMALVEFEDEPGCFVHHGPYDVEVLADTVESILESDVSVGPFTDKIPSISQMVSRLEGLFLSVMRPR